MKKSSITRRSFLELTGTSSLACALGVDLRGAARIPIAVQLYSVRRDAGQDFDAALEQVAAIGFEGVEFAGYYKYAGKGEELRRRLDALKLKAAGTHIGLETLLGDQFQPTVDFHQAIGCRFLVVPSNRDFTDPEKSKALADTFNGLAAKLKPLEMATGYHNHTDEFRKKDGERNYWDLFAERTTKDVILQQDCGWTFAAGFDPVAYVKKYPGRTRTAHFKPTVREGETGKAILGQDSVDWAAVYAACASAGGTEWVVVEQETYPDGKTPMECTRESLVGLRGIIK